MDAPAYMEEECDAHKETASDGRHLEKAALISQKPAANYKSPTGSLRSPQAHSGDTFIMERGNSLK